MNARLHHLDALRALTMLLVLPVHAVVIAGFHGGWNDAEATLFWLVHVFRVPLFFLLAGFFGAHLLRSHGRAGLLRNRLVRIVVPLVTVVVLVVPVLGLMLKSVSAIDPRPGSSGLGVFVDFYPHYVWFLWYLVFFYCGALALHALLARLPGVRGALHRGSRGLLSHWTAPLLLAVPCALLIYREPTWTPETPSESFLPHWDLLVYFATFFACGWALCSVAGAREAIESRPGRYTALGSVALPPALALYLLHGEPAVGTSRLAHVAAVCLFSVTTWALVFALLGAARRYLPEANPRLRYLADSSYWIFLSHFPVMAALAIALFAIPMPDGLRLPLLVLVTFCLIFPAYGAFVRHGAIGRILHGHRPREHGRSRAARLTPAGGGESAAA